MGVEEGKAERQKEAGPVSPPELLERSALPDFEAEERYYVNLCSNCSAINNAHLQHKCQDQNYF